MNDKERLEEILNETPPAADAEREAEENNITEKTEPEETDAEKNEEYSLEEETAEETATVEEAPKPKPLRALKRVDTGKTAGGVAHDPNAEVNQPQQPIEQPYNAYGFEDDEYDDNDEEKGYKPWVDIAVKVGSIALSLCIIFVLILNMPICLYSKNGEKKRVSILKYIDLWQPLAELEGEIDKTSVKTDIDKNKVPENYEDDLELDQLIEGQYTVLFLGFEPDNCNTDIIWIFQFDIKAKKLRILQIPRDTAVPDFTSSPTAKFNSIYLMGDQTLDVPIQRVVNAVQQNFGIPIDSYVTTKCSDIEQIIDIIGGVPITLENPINFSATQVIPAGDSVLNGKQSVWFMRYRSGWLEGDIGRVQNQRRFMAAAMKKMLDITNEEGLTTIYSYIKKIYDNKLIATDMTVGEMRRIADFCGNLTMDQVRMDMLPGEGTTKENPYVGSDGRKYSIYSIHKQETINLLNKWYRPYQTPLTGDGDTAMVEFITQHTYNNYDEKGDTLDNLLNSKEPARG